MLPAAGIGSLKPRPAFTFTAAIFPVPAHVVAAAIGEGRPRRLGLPSNLARWGDPVDDGAWAVAFPARA